MSFCERQGVYLGNAQRAAPPSWRRLSGDIVTHFANLGSEPPRRWHKCGSMRSAIRNLDSKGTASLH